MAMSCGICPRLLLKDRAWEAWTFHTFVIPIDRETFRRAAKRVLEEAFDIESVFKWCFERRRSPILNIERVVEDLLGDFTARVEIFKTKRDVDVQVYIAGVNWGIIDIAVEKHIKDLVKQHLQEVISSGPEVLAEEALEKYGIYLTRNKDIAKSLIKAMLLEEINRADTVGVSIIELCAEARKLLDEFAEMIDKVASRIVKIPSRVDTVTLKLEFERKKNKMRFSRVKVTSAGVYCRGDTEIC